ncbi:protein phosphatase 2C domain-containing protein [candidate division KSB1 bacterium]|nr:protein phosphatase 2C domain-containing protein [candidate division KSB1 bacterium]
MDEFNHRKILSLEVGCLTDAGDLRQHNEDSFGFYQPNDPDILYEKGEMYIAANGFGGKGVGDVASRIAVDIITKEYFNQPISLSVEESLRHAFQIANSRIYESLNRSLFKPVAGSTASCVVIQRSNVYVMHIGNSRLYQIKGFTIKQLTTDHTASLESPEALEQFRAEKPKTCLTKLLGSTEEAAPDFQILKLRPGDQLLLCTDGIPGKMENREIGRMVLKYSPREACEELIDAANARAGTDNLTVIIIKIKGLRSLSTIQRDGETPDVTTTSKSSKPREAAFSSKTIRLDEHAERSSSANEEREKPLQPPEELPDQVFSPPEDAPANRSAAQPRFQFQQEEDYQTPRGMHRRKIVSPGFQRKTFNVNWNIVILISLGTLLVATIFYLLLEGGTLARKIQNISIFPAAKEDTSEAARIPDRMTEIESEPEPENTSVPPVLPEEPAEETSSKTLPEQKMRLLIINGSASPTGKVTKFLNRLKEQHQDSVVISITRSALKITSHSKIIYRPPFEEDNMKVRGFATQIRDIAAGEFASKLEIIPCDLSIVLGRDYSQKNVNILNLKRFHQFTDIMPNMHVKRIEILNGSGASGIANALKKDLDYLILDDDKTYIQVIDARNAISVNHPRTIIRCYPSENTTAEKIARILGVQNPEQRVVNENVNDIIVVLGRDFL